jgi:hypothetical protein
MYLYCVPALSHRVYECKYKTAALTTSSLGARANIDLFLGSLVAPGITSSDSEDTVTISQ